MATIPVDKLYEKVKTDLLSVTGKLEAGRQRQKELARNNKDLAKMVARLEQEVPAARAAVQRFKDESDAEIQVLAADHPAPGPRN